MIEKFLEIDGIDKGRIKDADIARELAETDLAWREENGGTEMPPERPGKPVFTHEQLLNGVLERLIVQACTEETQGAMKTLYNHPSSQRPTSWA